MPTFGVIPTGFRAKTLDEHLTDINDGCRAAVSPILNLNSYTPLGQINGIMASKCRELTELAQACYTLLDPDSASDAQLTNLSKLTGTDRRDATFSQVFATCDLDAGTYAAGALVASVVGAPDSRFANRDSITSAGGSNPGLVFVAEASGPVQALAGTLTIIAQPVVGWNSVTNPADAEEGLDVETDPALRLRREAEIAPAGSASDLALAAGVSEVDGVLSVRVFSNDEDATDANGVPGHCQEVVLFDGIVPSADDDEIAQAIWDNKTGGIRQVGTDSGTAVDSEGTNQIVKFSRVTVSNVYLEIDVERLADGYVGDAAVKTALVTWGDANLGIGTDVRERAISREVMSLDGVQDVTEIRLGFTASPVGVVNLTIGSRAIADLDTARIVVNSSIVAAT